MTAQTRLGIVAVWWMASAGCSNPAGVIPTDDMMGCAEGTTRCGEACSDLTKDGKNCGACGMVCEDGNLCVDGKCVLVCPKGQSACDNKSCHDVMRDPANCGGCGKACPNGQVCVAGACSTVCPMGQTICDGFCIDLARDPQNCGACKMACPQGNACEMGKCVVKCVNGQELCDGVCANTDNDAKNCGKCGNACMLGFSCVAKACKLVCPQGLSDCNGTCVNLQGDNDNCGACASKCPQGQVCSQGKCDVKCLQGYENCNGDCVKLMSDGQNCGKCGNPCKNTEQCVGGACKSLCVNGQMDCGGLCVNPKSDPANCGGCAMKCPQDQVCVDGACKILCKDPLKDCSSVCVDPRFDPAHCGGCGMACKPAPNSTPGCNMGNCNIGMCDKNFNNCDGVDANGCESNQLSDNKNCAGCGKPCKLTDACCGGGGCQNVMVDNSNCGACGKVCGQGLKCCGGACLDPKFSMVLSLDCKKPFVINSTTGGEFGMNGKVDQLDVGNGGIITVDPMKNPLPAQSPHVWVAAHGTNQVHKIDAKTGALLGSYPTRGNHPSRITQSLDNSVWIANRGDNDPNNGDVSNVTQILPDGTPACTIRKAKDGAAMPFMRAIAIDGNGFVWAGSWNDARLHKIDPAKCAVVADFPMQNQTVNGVGHSSYPYGLAVDRNQILWNSSLGSGSHMGLDVLSADPAKNTWKQAVAQNGCSYGIVIDLKNNIYLSRCDAAGINRIDNQTRQLTYIAGNPAGGGCGMTIDTKGDIYQAGGYYGAGAYVMKYEGGTGRYLGAYQFLVGQANVKVSNTYMFGPAGDTYGKLWVTDRTNGSVTRFNPDGTVDFQNVIPGGGANDFYNYSDWTSIVLKTVTANNAQAGTWTREYDSGSPLTSWATATWEAMTPQGTSVAVYFKAGANPADFAKQTSCGPFYTQPVDLTACNFGLKQWLQVIVVLNTNDVNVRPTMSNLKVYYQ